MVIEQAPGIAEQRFRLLQDLTTTHRRLDFARRSLEELHAQDGLELAHLLAQRRLGHSARLGCPPKIAFPGNGNGVFEITQRER